jgi:outer membrane lipoprotein-sorting protein
VADRPEGVSLRQRLRMELEDRRGQKRTRETETFRKYYGKEKRTVVFFDKPGNVRGTAFLTYDYPEPERDDAQWLYLPAARKVRRISAADRGGYFLGTDFTYDDVKKAGKLDVAEYDLSRLPDAAVDGHPCLVVEGKPRTPEIASELGYGRIRLWIDPEIWMTRRAQMWDVAGNDLKTVDTTEIREVDGFWTAHRIEARNRKTGHRTLFVFEDSSYAAAVDDDVFTERALQRGR